MQSYPDAIEELMLFLKQLPGVGKRGAERMVLAMLEWDKSDLSALASACALVVLLFNKFQATGSTFTAPLFNFITNNFLLFLT